MCHNVPYKNSSGFQGKNLSIYYYLFYKDTNFRFRTKPLLFLYIVTHWLSFQVFVAEAKTYSFAILGLSGDFSELQMCMALGLAF